MQRILIVEDVFETRNWLIDLAKDAFTGAEITAVATVREARQALRWMPDLALIDLGLPDGSGLDVLRAIRESGSETLCVVTTVMGDDATVVAALSAGADGYLLKESPRAVLAGQLARISEGIPPLSPAIARRIMEHFRRTGPVMDEHTSLTRRELEVLALIARGMRNTEVAAELNLAVTTVAGYIKTIYRKLGISSRAEAAWHAASMGLSETEPRKPD
jgi:DNA-binding NarL/FixJ family response regulator